MTSDTPTNDDKFPTHETGDKADVDAVAEEPAEAPTDEGSDAAEVDAATEGLVLKETDALVDAGPPACENCSEPLIPDQRFCEACGQDTNPEADGPTCVDCGAPQREIDQDGYCSQCGRKQPDNRDHFEIDEGTVAGTTDKGLSHHRNEDAFAVVSLANGGITVVCDGVSSTGEPQKASQAAADAAAESLAAAVRNGAPDMEEATREAVADAQIAVLKASEMVGANEPPSCTVVATTALADPTSGEISVIVGWLGDSRGYWVDRIDGLATSVQLTKDDSWARIQIESGAMGEEEAMAQPQAHSITKWLGADALDTVPQVVTHEGSAGGYALSCSDGLWNYLQDEQSLNAKLQELDDLSVIDRTRELVNFANESGGHDNITVAIVQFPDPPQETEQ